MLRHHILFHCAVLGILSVLVSAQLAWAHDSGFGIARYLSDGTLDRSFGSDGLVVVHSARGGFVANALSLQPDGGILVGGLSSSLPDPTVQLAIARYMPDGAVDESFGTHGTATTPVGVAGAVANAVKVLSDGKILVAGTSFSNGSSGAKFALARYMPNGILDSTFGAGNVVLTQVGVGEAGAETMLVQPDGRVILVGTAFSNGATDDFALARYMPDGALDPAFGSGGIVTTQFGSGDGGAGLSLARGAAAGLLPDGRIVVAGFTRGDRPGFALARYMPDGRLDPGFGSGGRVHLHADDPQVFGLVLETGGQVVVAGTTTSGSNATAPFAVLRFGVDGTLDQTFGNGGFATTTIEGSASGARAVVGQADGKLVTGGAKFGDPSPAGDALAQSGFALARYNSDGSVDKAFGSGGQVVTDIGDAGATPLAIVIQPDGKIVAAGLVFFNPTPAQAPRVGFDSILQHINPLTATASAVAVLMIALVVRTLVRRNNL